MTLYMRTLIARILHRVSQRHADTRLSGGEGGSGVEIGCFLINSLRSGRTAPIPHALTPAAGRHPAQSYHAHTRRKDGQLSAGRRSPGKPRTPVTLSTLWQRELEAPHRYVA